MRLIVLGACAFLLAVLPAPADAAVWLELEPTAASPGSTVHGRTGGEGGLSSGAGETLELYLVPDTAQIGHRDEDRGVWVWPDEVPPGARALAPLVVDTEGNGYTEFVVPDVGPGGYVLVMACPMCDMATGESLVPVGEFTVLAAGSSREELARTGSTAALRLAQSTVVSALLGIALIAATRHRTTRR